MVRALGIAFRALVALSLIAGLAHAADGPQGDLLPVPALTSRVIDQTQTLSAADAVRIASFLKDYEQRKGAQIAVLIVDSTGSETAFDYSMRVVDSWKLGRKDIDDGVLLLVVKSDRKLELRTGRGVQGSLTDVASKRIIREVISPRFKAGDFAGGIEEGVQRIAAVIDGESLPAPSKRAQKKGASLEHFLGLAFFAALIVGPLLRALLGRFLGASATAGIAGFAAWWIAGGLLFPIAVIVLIFFVVLLSGIASSGRWQSRGGGWTTTSSGGSGGSSWGDSSSDSFSGGGGGFDGGGASGDW